MSIIISNPQINTQEENNQEEKSSIQTSPFNKGRSFTVIDNELLDNEEMSNDTKLMLIYLKRLPPNWVIYTNWLMKKMKVGESKILAMLKEAMAFGHIHYEDIKQKENPNLKKRRKYFFLEIPDISLCQKLNSRCRDLEKKGVETVTLKNKVTEIVNETATRVLLLSTKSSSLSFNSKNDSSIVPSEPCLAKAKRSTISFSEEDKKEVESFVEKLLKFNERATIPKDLDKWANEFRLLHSNPKITRDDIFDIIEWVFQDDFWQSVVQSPSGLRKNYSTIYAQYFKKASIKKRQEYLEEHRALLGDRLKGLEYNDKWIRNTLTGESISINLPKAQFKDSLDHLFPKQRMD